LSTWKLWGKVPNGFGAYTIMNITYNDITSITDAGLKNVVSGKNFLKVFVFLGFKDF